MHFVSLIFNVLISTYFVFNCRIEHVIKYWIQFLAMV